MTNMTRWSISLALVLSLSVGMGMAEAQEDGTLVGFGANGHGQINVPTGTFKAIAAGGYHSIAIREDGTLVGWGDNTDGQINVPAGTFKAVATSDYYSYYSLAIREDGTLVGWGNNDYGQINVPTGTFKAVAAGGYHGLAIREDGTLAGWGVELGADVGNIPTGIFKAIAAGSGHSLGLREDGTIASWGNYLNDQLGDLPVDPRIPPTGIFKAIAAGSVHSLAIREDGTLVGWGGNDYGQINVPTGAFTAIDAGLLHSIGIREDGTIAGWGFGIGFGPIPTGTFTAIDAGGYHSLAIREVVQDTPTVFAVADAGPDQTVNEGGPVALDGSQSAGVTLTYHWSQLAGPPVSLNLTDLAHPTFTAPQAPIGGTTLTFQLIVSSGQQTSNPDTVNINVLNVNHSPVSDAGPDQTVQEESSVMLDGSGSFDPDSELITYQWTQAAGPAVVLSSTTVQKPTFTAPLVGVTGAMLTFELIVHDGQVASAPETVKVLVQNVNRPPTANAGPDQTKNEGTLVTLNGTASSDSDSDPLTYQWTQVSDPAVALSDPTNASPTFTAPLVGPGGATLVFQLVVHDGWVASASDTVAITVLNVNDPPVCSLAQATPASLWPPTHTLVSVGIVGVADPDNDQITLTVTGVTQDEPINGLGDGDTSPDAVLQGSTALLRAERSGTGNGRVYELTFTASDDQGGSCIGRVKVQVPHSRKGTAVEDGQLYDSTLP